MEKMQNTSDLMVKLCIFLPQTVKIVIGPLAPGRIK